MAKRSALPFALLAAVSLPVFADGIGWNWGGIGIVPNISDACQLQLLQAAADPHAKATIALATGTALPNDAGKYQMCLDGGRFRYFLASMNATMNANGNSVSMPVELGVCLPDLCIDTDIPGIFNNAYSKQLIPALSMVNLTMITATSPQLDVKSAHLGTWIALTVVLIFVALVLAATWNEMSSRLTVARSALTRENMTQLLDSGELRRSGSGISTPGSTRGGSEPAPEPSGSMTPQSVRGSSVNGDARTQGMAAVAAANQRLRAPGPLARMMQPFSLLGDNGTLPKVAEIPPYKPTDSLNGLRALSMFWIVLGHTFLMPKGIAGYSNIQDLITTPLQKNGVAENDASLQFVLGAQISVDTFFFLSGFLLSMLTLQELRARRGKTNLSAAIVLRYIRLTPSLALAMLVYYQILPYLGNGPFSPRYQESILGRCDGSWWSELTYTLNFLPFDSDKVCMGWTWYLGDDMIFFIVSIGILPLYYRAKWMGWVTVGVISCASFAVTIWLCYKFGLSPYVFDDHYKDYSYWSYSKPYSRVPAYFVGLVSAWILDDLENVHGITRQNRIHTLKSRMLATFTFLACVAILIAIVLLPATDFGLHKNDWDKHEAISAIYLTFSRPLWAAMWAIITILCYYDYLPLVNGFLAHRVWTPFARLTYGAYLCHPIVIKLTAGNATQYYNFSWMDLFYRTLGNTVLAYGGALVLWCLVERPTMTFTSMLLKNKTRGAAAQRVATVAAVTRNGQVGGSPQKPAAPHQ